MKNPFHTQYWCRYCGKIHLQEKGVYDQNYKTTQLTMNETSGEH